MKEDILVSKIIDLKKEKDAIILAHYYQDPSIQDIADFVERWEIDYLVLTDINGEETFLLTSEYGKVTGRPISGVPSTFIIDRDGYIVKSYVGPRSEEVFYKDLKPYL